MSGPLTTLVVERARSLIAEPTGCCHLNGAQTTFGRPHAAFHPSTQRYCANCALHRAAFVLTGEKDAGKACAHLTAKSLTGIDERAAATRELVVLDDCYGHAAVPSMFDALLEQTSMAEQTSASVV